MDQDEKYAAKASDFAGKCVLGGVNTAILTRAKELEGNPGVGCIEFAAKWNESYDQLMLSGAGKDEFIGASRQ